MSRRRTKTGRLANADADEGWPVHIAADTPIRNATIRGNTAISCVKGDDGPERQQDRGGTGSDKPWKPRRESNRCEHHRLGMIASKTRPEEVTLEKGNCHSDTRACK